MHCLTSSEPILPPAPVTRTRLPLINFFIEFLSSEISSLPSKSTGETSLKSEADTLPSINSDIDGRVLKGFRVFLHSSIILSFDR